MGPFQKQLHKSLENNTAPHDTSAVPGKINQPLLKFLDLQWPQQRTLSGFRVFMHILGHSVLSLFPSSFPDTLFSGLFYLLLFQRPAAHGVIPKADQSWISWTSSFNQPHELHHQLILNMFENVFSSVTPGSHLREGVWKSFNTFQQFCSTENIFKEKLFISSTEEGVWLWSSFSCFTLGELPEIIQTIMKAVKWILPLLYLQLVTPRCLSLWLV